MLCTTDVEESHLSPDTAHAGAGDDAEGAARLVRGVHPAADDAPARVHGAAQDCPLAGVCTLAAMCLPGTKDAHIRGNSSQRMRPSSCPDAAA